MKRKSKLMRASGVLLVLTLITSSLVGGTFAKYVTTGTAEDSARVAKWGVDVEWTGAMFSSVYKNPTDATTTVQADEKVVAPGTKGGPLALSISGTPEVSVKVTTDVSVDLGNNWMVDTNSDESVDIFYCPLVFTLNNVEIADGKDYSSVEALEDKIAEEIQKVANNRTFQAGDSIDANCEIEWEWPFETEGNDAYDTYLGDQAAADNAATVSMTLTTTVTQID